MRLENITDAGLKNLEGLRNLTELDLSKSQVTDSGLKYLNRLTKLVKLNLSDTPVTEAGLVHLRELPVEELDLSGTRIEFVTLEGFSSLAYLDLGRTRLTDSGLKRSSGLGELQVLILRDTRITDEGREVYPEDAWTEHTGPLPYRHNRRWTGASQRPKQTCEVCSLNELWSRTRGSSISRGCPIWSVCIWTTRKSPMRGYENLQRALPGCVRYSFRRDGWTFMIERSLHPGLTGNPKSRDRRGRQRGWTDFAVGVRRASVRRYIRLIGNRNRKSGHNTDY